MRYHTIKSIEELIFPNTIAAVEDMGKWVAIKVENANPFMADENGEATKQMRASLTIKIRKF